MKIVATEFDRLVVIEPTVFGDARGFLLETWNQPRYALEGMPDSMVQDNLSRSARGVLRGLHFQNPHAQAKLVFVLEGEIFDVAVDIRRGSPTFAKCFSVRLSADNRRQVYIPSGFAHGFCVLSDSALVSYKCSEIYRPETEMTIVWNDPRLAIDWPIDQPSLSPKDAGAPRFEQIPPERLPTWDGGTTRIAELPSTMNILLIGARGRLGKELARSLAPHGQLIECAGPSARPASGGAGGLEVRQVDLARPERLREIVSAVRPRLIVNAAAYTTVEAAEREPLEAQAVNATAPGVLAEEARKIGAALVHYSTDYVFDGRGDRPWREDDPTGPLNVYGRTKLAGEEAIRRTGADHLIIRTSWLYATHGQSFATKMFDLASRQSEISMVSDQIGAPTSARLVADVTAAIIARSAGDPAALLRAAGGTLHVACAGQTSWYAFAKVIFEQARELGLPLATPTIRPILSSDRPQALARPLNSRLDISRLKERFSLTPPSWDTEFKAHLPGLYAQYWLDAGAANTE